MYDEYPQLGQKLAAITLGDYLEFGCGGGGFLKYVLSINASFTSLTAVDINPNSVDAARSELAGQQIQFIVQEHLPLPLPDHEISTITLSNTLHHLRDKGAVLHEIKRLLKPRGKLVVTEMVSDGLTPAEVTYFTFHALRAELDQLKKVYHDATYTAEQIKIYLADAGMHVMDSTIIPNDKADLRNAQEEDNFMDAADSLLHEGVDLMDPAKMKQKVNEVKSLLQKHGLQRPRQLYLELTV